MTVGADTGLPRVLVTFSGNIMLKAARRAVVEAPVESRFLQPLSPASRCEAKDGPFFHSRILTGHHPHPAYSVRDSPPPMKSRPGRAPVLPRSLCLPALCSGN